MAIAGFTVTVGTTGAGTGTTIRDAMAANLSGAWTVGAVQSIGSGTTLSTCWAVAHSGGVEFLFVQNEGSSADPSNAIFNAGASCLELNQGVSADGQLNFAVCANDGTKNFSDVLYTDGLLPNASAFYDDLGTYSHFGDVGGVAESNTGIELAIWEDTAAAVLCVTGKIGLASFSNYRSFILGGDIMELAGVPVNADQDPYLALVGAESESDAGGNDFIDWAASFCVNGQRYEETGYYPTGNHFALGVFTGAFNPDPGGVEYYCQAIPAETGDTNHARLWGRLNPSYLRILPQSTFSVLDVVSDVTSSEEFYHCMDSLLLGWNSTDLSGY